jgi:hypothetical protein
MSKQLSIALTDDQRTTLHTLIRSGSARARTHTRARILLLLDRNQAAPLQGEAVAKGLRCHRNNKPLPPRAPKKITGEVEAHLIALACSAPPEGQRRRSLRLLANRLVELGLVDHISYVAVGARLKKTPCNRGG